MRQSYEEALKENVKRGAKLLDEKVPSWYTSINLDTLELSSCLECILGQLFGHYSDGLTELKIDFQNSIASDSPRYYYGFSVCGNVSSTWWKALTELWKQEVLARRNNG